MSKEEKSEAWRLSAYKMTAFEYQLRLKEQGGVCAICRKPPDSRPLVIDHCHITGIIRGLLHQKCNTAIGLLGDNPELLRNAATYLEKM
jgi:Recombination endonuclease VII